MGKANVRHVVADVDAAVTFYTDLPDFRVEMQPRPGFAILPRGAPQLSLKRGFSPESATSSSAKTRQ